jgi:hypothetical protein
MGFCYVGTWLVRQILPSLQTVEVDYYPFQRVCCEPFMSRKKKSAVCGDYVRPSVCDFV